MNVLISVIGETPAIITECIEEFSKIGVGINKVIVLYTKRMLRSFKLLKVVFLNGFYNGRIVLHGRELPFDDVISSRESIIFRSILNSIIREEVVDNNVYLLVSGGRKSMVVDSTLAALANRLDYLYYVRLPKGADVLKSDTLLATYNLDECMNKIPQDIKEYIINIFHPNITEPILIEIPLPKLDTICINYIIKSMLSYGDNSNHPKSYAS